MKFAGSFRCPNCYSDVVVGWFAGKVVLKASGGFSTITYPNPRDGGKCPNPGCGVVIEWDSIREVLEKAIHR